MQESSSTPAPRLDACGLCQQVSPAIGEQQGELALAKGEDLCTVCEELCPQGAACCEFIIVWDSKPGIIGGQRA